MKKENVICVTVQSLKKAFDLSREYWTVGEADINQMLFGYVARERVEYDFTYKQLIPYALVLNHKNELLVYQRCGSEKRLSGLFSVGIGGHVNDKDLGETLYDRLVTGLKREFAEEVGLRLRSNQITLKGMINEEETSVGHCHTGVVFVVNLGEEVLTFDEEIGNPQWLSLDNLELSNFELWSSLAISLIK